MKTKLLLDKQTLATIKRYISRPNQPVLLTGREHIGKALLTCQLAAQLLDLDEVSFMGYPYKLILEPIDGKITIEQIRTLNEFARLVVPGQSRIARVICILDADTMTREAQNAFLKLLEEPPSKTAIIMSSSHYLKLLPTIRSRTQRLIVRVPPEEEIISAYVAQGHRPDEIKRALVVTQGSLGLFSGIFSPDSTITATVGLVKRVLSSDVFTRLTFVDSDLKDKKVAKEFVKVLIMVAQSSFAKSGNLDWARILEAATIAETALEKRANRKLVLTELMLTL